MNLIDLDIYDLLFKEFACIIIRNWSIIMTEIIKKKKPKNYLNNADLMKEIELSHAQNKMTNELGKMIMVLCKRYAKHPDYSNVFSHEEDMQAFGLLTVVKVWKSFNPEKSKNPFAYFTQILRHAFYQYGNSEKKAQDTKKAVKKDLGLNPSFMELLEMERVGRDNFIVGFEDSSDTESDVLFFNDSNTDVVDELDDKLFIVLPEGVNEDIIEGDIEKEPDINEEA